MNKLNPASCPVYLLAGGRSSRFGSDKARVTVAGKSQLEQLCGQLQTAGHAVHVVADRADRFQDLGFQCLVDKCPESGPLAGLAAAIEHRLSSEQGWLLLVACDQLVWNQAWFEQLAEQTLAEASNDLALVTFSPIVDLDANLRASHRRSTKREPHVQPIPGLYHTKLAELVSQRLTASELSLKSLADAVANNARVVQSEHNPADWSFNDAQELQNLMR